MYLKIGKYEHFASIFHIFNNLNLQKYNVRRQTYE